MTITIPSWVLAVIGYSFAAALTGFLLWLVLSFWIGVYDKAATLLGLHKELMYFLINRKTIRKSVEAMKAK